MIVEVGLWGKIILKKKCFLCSCTNVHTHAHTHLCTRTDLQSSEDVGKAQHSET